MKAVLAVAAALAVAPSDVEVGTVDQKPPAKDQLKVPRTDDGVPKVELHATVKGKAQAGEKRHLYVLVSPIGNPELAGTWWVQGEVTRDGAGFAADAQFGEEAAGAGEYFAVLGVATDKSWSVGDKLTELPAGATCSKVKVVKRTAPAAYR